MTRIGWIGCGTHANEMLLPQLARLPVKIVALCDVDAKRLGQIGDRYGVTPRYADAAELLAHEELDAIGLAVGPALNVELGIEALSRGLPVFMEKPPAPTADAAQRFADEAARSGKPCVVGFMKRYSTANRIAGNIFVVPSLSPGPASERRECQMPRVTA